MNIIVECALDKKLPKKAEPTQAALDYGCTACEYILKNKIHRCSKFIFLSGKDPQSEDNFKETGKCIDAWQPILQLETSMTNRGQTQALESFRNEMVKGNEKFIEVMEHQQLPPNDLKMIKED